MEQWKSEIERSNMRMVSFGLRLKIIAMMLLFGALLLFLFEFVFFPMDAFSIHVVQYALGTLLALTIVDFMGRLLCWKWPKDKSARLSVIGSTACQLGPIVVLIIALIESKSGGVEPLLLASFSVYCLLIVVAQGMSAYLFLGYTRKICWLLGQDDKVRQPTVVLAAYGLSCFGAVVLIMLLILLFMIAFCFSFLGGMIIFTTIWFRIMISASVLILVFFPFRSYGLFLDGLAKAIDERRLAKW